MSSPSFVPLVFTALAALVSGAASAQSSAASPAFESVSHVYRCTGGARLPVVYLNLEGGGSFATIYVNGRLVLMRIWPAASGVRYLSVDEQVGYRWHVKGDVGTLLFLAADHTARETVVLQDCKVQRQP